MKTAVMAMLVLITCSIWFTWLNATHKNWRLERTILLIIATMVMTALTVGYGTYYGVR